MHQKPPERRIRPVREGLAAGCILFALTAGFLFFFHRQASDTLREESRASLARTAALAATFVDGDAVDTIISQGHGNSPTWERAVAPLRQLVKLTGDIRYAYVMRLDGDTIRFVLDASPKGDLDHDGIEDFSRFGDPYLWAPPELLKALREGTRETDQRLIRDPWGIFLSAYAPVRNSRGVLQGVVGIDIDAKDWILGTKRMREALVLGLLLAASFSTMAGFGLWARRRSAWSQREKSRQTDLQERLQAQAFTNDLESKVRARTSDLRQANQELQRALRTRESFLAAANHELRTPLQSLISSSEMLARGMVGPLSVAQERRIATIHRCARHLHDLVSRLLDLSSARTGSVEIFRERLDLDALCEECIAILSDLSRERGLEVHVHPSNAVHWIEADASRLRQVVLNLLENALRFTPPGGTVSIATDSVGKNLVSISVSDSGPGIPEDQRSELFRSLDDVVLLSSGDPKMGLPLSAWIISLHGGTLRYESHPEGGSIFTIRLPTPFAPLDPIPLSSTLHEPAEQLVLIVEDNVDIRETLAEYIESLGYRVATAVNGCEALDAVERERPSLVLMDVQMPAMDGLEATKRLRADSANATLPILVMTAFASGEDAERCIDAGASGYLSKPVELRRLDRVIGEHVRRA